MSQTRKRSVYESLVGVSVGIAYAIPLNYIMVNMKWPDQWTYAVANTLVFTAISLIWKFVLRRIFNWLDQAHPVERKWSVTSPDGNFEIDQERAIRK